MVGGMETRFQCRKAHRRTAKCEAFHFAPRLFFMFFVFDSIHDSATMHNLSPSNFPLSPKNPPPTNPWLKVNTLIRGERIRGDEGIKKAAWERSGFQAAAYLD